MPRNASSDPASASLRRIDLDISRPNSNAGRKPKEGSRSRLANRNTPLSAEKRARKRAADRAAQRASRQRTQERIERLQARIGELENDAVDTSEHEALVRRNVELEEELRKLRAVLEGFGAETKVDPVCPTRPISDGLPTPPLQPAILPRNLPTNVAVTIPSKFYPAPPSEFASGQPTKTTSRPEQTASSVESVSDSERDGSPTATITNTDTALRPQDKDLKKKSNTSKLRSIRQTSASQMNHTILTSFIKQPSLRVWEIPPAFKKATTPVEKILYGMVEYQRSLATKGITGAKLVGPRKPSLGALVAPGRTRPPHIVARIISELLSRITYRTFVDKLAGFMAMYPVYQWLIMQSYETYCNMPTWQFPVLSQRTTPHPVWIAALGYPKLREVIIANQEKYTTDEFQFLFVENLNANWPHGVEAALSWNDGDITVSQAFWDHTRDVANFTVEEPFWARYPELRECIPNQNRPKSDQSGSL